MTGDGKRALQRVGKEMGREHCRGGLRSGETLLQQLLAGFPDSQPRAAEFWRSNKFILDFGLFGEKECNQNAHLKSGLNYFLKYKIADMQGYKYSR